MIVYVLTDFPYHDNETIFGAFESQAQALDAARIRLPSDSDWYITEVKVGELKHDGWATKHDSYKYEGKEKNVP